jgi:hypothetical protein
MTTFGEIGYINLGDCISCIDFSAGGDYFAAGCTDESMYLWYLRIKSQESKLRAIRRDRHSKKARSYDGCDRC